MLETVKHLESEGFDVDIVSPDLTGRVSEEKILEKVKDNTLLVSVMHVNNETGIIQPVKRNRRKTARKRDPFSYRRNAKLWKIGRRDQKHKI